MRPYIISFLLLPSGSWCILGVSVTVCVSLLVASKASRCSWTWAVMKAVSCSSLVSSPPPFIYSVITGSVSSHLHQSKFQSLFGPLRFICRWQKWPFAGVSQSLTRWIGRLIFLFFNPSDSSFYLRYHWHVNPLDVRSRLTCHNSSCQRFSPPAGACLLFCVYSSALAASRAPPQACQPPRIVHGLPAAHLVKVLLGSTIHGWQQRVCADVQEVQSSG